MRSIVAVLITLLAVVGPAFAKVDAKPATKPAATPATSPTTQASKFPTPAELVAKMKEMRKERDAMLKVAYIDLSTDIVEKPADFSIFGESDAMTLRSVINRLQKARDDKDIKGALITISGASIGLAQAQEVRDALVELRQAGKKTFVYADSYDTATYTLATGATDICMLEGGEILIPGVGGEAMFAKGLLDKVGVKADYVQIGEYKGADEQYTRTGASEELRGELNKLMDSLYGQIVDGIAQHRKLSPDAVKRLIDESMMSAKEAAARGLIDHTVDQDGLRDLIAKKISDKKEKVELVHRYGLAERGEVDLSSPFGFFAMLSRRPPPSTKPTVALIYADGEIIDGRGGEGMLGGSSVGSEDMRRALRTAGKDENVKAVVLRIDSPGGSALASEVMWQAARRVAKDKPLVISVGSMAASGGYYLASAGDYIFADPAGIVGSIGVVGGKFVMKDLYDKLGLTTESFMRGRNAGLFSSNQPFDVQQREMVTTWMKRTYAQFTERVMTTRKGKIKDIDKVARGRIFVAQVAKDLGMVDELGGVEKAIAYAADRADLKEGEFDVRTLPAPRTLADFFGGGGGEAATPIRPSVKIDPTSLFAQLSPSVKRALVQHVRLMQILEDRPVALMAPFIISVR